MTNEKRKYVVANLSGIRFGKLVIIKYIKYKGWLSKCDCGNETIAKTSCLNNGKKRSCGCLIGKSAIGKKASLETKIKLSLAKAGKQYRENNPYWKGDNISYHGMHRRIVAIKGKAIKCIACNEQNQRINWANIDHKYRYNQDEYISLCPKCHKEFDLLFNFKLINPYIKL